MTQLLNKKVVVILLAIGGLLGAPAAAWSNDVVAEQVVHEQAIAAEMIKLIQQISRQRLAEAQDPEPSNYHYRFNQVKTLGCFDARFTVLDKIPQGLKKGLFAQAGTYKAKLRFANASTFDDTKKDLRGLSIRVEVPTNGEKAAVQTFLMNSHPVLFADTPETFLKFIRATAQGRRWWFFFNPFDAHFNALWILLNARENHSSPFDVQYWTTTPSQFGGQGSAAKFSARPCSQIRSDVPDELTNGYLQKNMWAHLEQGDVCFELLVQRQRDPEAQPIDDASVLWDPDAAPYESVARLEFAQQDFQSNAALMQCEREVFDPWATLAEHKPIGSMNRVRQAVYDAMASFRLNSHTSNAGDP